MWSHAKLLHRMWSQQLNSPECSPILNQRPAMKVSAALKRLQFEAYVENHEGKQLIANEALDAWMDRAIAPYWRRYVNRELEFWLADDPRHRAVLEAKEAAK